MVFSLFMLWLPACSGSIGSPAADSQDHAGESGQVGTGGSPGTSSDGVIPVMPAKEVEACLAAAAKPSTAGTVFRRLNRTEYNNTVRDLLGDTTAPAKAFPAEERAFGFDNNAQALATPPDLIEQYVTAAESLAIKAVSGIATLAPCDNPASNAKTCGLKFIDAFGPKAFRRPLQAKERDGLTAILNEGLKTDYAAGIRMVIEALLQSAPFLYRVEAGQGGGPNGLLTLSSWEMASRISYFVIQSMPDAALFAAAAANQLSTPTQIATHVARLMKDPRAADMVARFHDQWLHFELLSGLVKDEKLFPDFGPQAITSLQTQSRKFIDEWVWKDGGRLESLFSSRYTFVDTTLAKLLRMPNVSGAGFVKTTLDDKRQAGVLSQPALMAMLAHANQTAPVHRGKFVREQLLCDELAPPPPDLSISPPKLDPSLTTRERFAAHSSQPACRGCHQMMDPIGLGFENFDALGRFITNENGKPIDAQGELVGTDVDATFDGAGELQARLATSMQVKQCVARNWFRFAMGRKESDDDACTLARLTHVLEQKEGGIPELLAEITRSDAFVYRSNQGQ